MKKIQKDLITSWENRLEAAAQSSKNGIYIYPVHPHLEITEEAIKSARLRNTLVNRIVELQSTQEMGLDMEIAYKGYPEKKRLIWRWFSDPDIFIKDTKEKDILRAYKNAIFIFSNMPLKDKDKKLKWFHLLPFYFIEQQGWTWLLRGTEGNKNRLVLVDRKGAIVSPQKLTKHNIEGGVDIFGNFPNFQNALKKLWK